MGLDFRFSDDFEFDNIEEDFNPPSFAYHGFHLYRVKLAKQFGIDLEMMYGFGLPERSAKSWDTVDNPIKIFLSHSDCDGEMTSDECKAVSPILRQAVADWDDEPTWRERTYRLCDMMDICAKYNTQLVFC